MIKINLRYLFQLRIEMLIFLVTIFLFNNAIAASNSYIVDIYGTSKISKEEVKSEFNNELTTIVNSFKNPSFASSKNGNDPILNAFSQIIGKLMLANNFAYVRVSPIHYPDKPSIYI